MIYWIMLGIFCASVVTLSLLRYCRRRVISGLELDLDYPGSSRMRLRDGKYQFRGNDLGIGSGTVSWKEHGDENVSDDCGVMMQLIIELDEDDARAWNQAAAFRQQFRDDLGCILPDSESSRAGVILGEICRAWLESHGQWDWADG